MTKIRVQIVDREHPHFGEHGVLTGEVITVLGTPMAKVDLDACRHGVDGCFVTQGQVAEELAVPRPRRPRR